VPIDLNADLGEGFGRWALGADEALLDLISSANVACGFHAGDPSILRKVCEGAAARGVRVGAQVSYRDLAGFGRRAMDVPSDELRDEVLYQLGALDGFCRVAGIAVAYVKPHGALYNRCFVDEVQAAAVVEAIVDYGGGLTVLGQPGSALLRMAAEAGLPTAFEAFADRAYESSGALVPRSVEGSVIHDRDRVADRVVGLATTGEIEAVDGTMLAVDPRSVCLHSDTPGAVELAIEIRRRLAEADVAVEPFL
jgi:5-oxoprolinase (ATP-hydrolysing) subunit A